MIGAASLSIIDIVDLCIRMAPSQKYKIPNPITPDSAPRQIPKKVLSLKITPSSIPKQPPKIPPKIAPKRITAHWVKLSPELFMP